MKTNLISLATILTLSTSGAAFAKSETLKVAPAKSTVQWTGSKVVGGSHTGKVNVKSGNVTLDDGKLKSGEIVVDMTSIVDEDLTDKEFNQKLVGHLKSPDFFDVEKHQTAKITVDKAALKQPGVHEVTGTLSIKDKTKPVTFTVTEGKGKDGRTAKTELTFDRTDFDVRYGSGKFFQNLGDKVIADQVQLEVNLVLE